VKSWGSILPLFSLERCILPVLDNVTLCIYWRELCVFPFLWLIFVFVFFFFFWLIFNVGKTVFCLSSLQHTSGISLWDLPWVFSVIVPLLRSTDLALQLPLSSQLGSDPWGHRLFHLLMGASAQPSEWAQQRENAWSKTPPIRRGLMIRPCSSPKVPNCEESSPWTLSCSEWLQPDTHSILHRWS
jgi:hypothetical protein